MPKVLVSDTNLTNIAEAIRFKYHGATTSYTPAAMASAIRNITPSLQSKTITPTTNQQTITADSNYEGLETVTIQPIPSQYIVPTGTFTVTSNATYDIKNYASVVVSVVGPTPSFQSKTVTPSTVTQVIQADSNYDALDVVTVEPIPAGYIVPTGTTVLASNDTSFDVTNYTSAYVDIPLQAISVTPTSSNQTIYPSSGYEGISRVTVNAIPAPYTIPAGTITITASGSYNVTNYASANVQVSSPTPTFQTKTVTPSITVQTVTPDTNYDGLDKVVVNAMPNGVLASPTITINSNGLIQAAAFINTEGYLAQGSFAENSLQLTTISGTTITPSTVTQTYGAANRYMLGTVTIQGDADLIPANIASGINIFGVTGTLEFVNYFTGTATPATSLGNNGDLYFQIG